MTKSIGAVAAGDRQTAQAGAEILRAGGSAVDAICAAAFAAFVAELPLCSPAGGGALLFGDTQRGFHLLDFFACAPGLGLQAGPRTLDFHVVDVDFGPTVQQFHVGRGSVATPGAIQGLLEAHRRAGRLPLSEVVAPAIALARDGYTLSAPVQHIVDILRPIVTLTPGVRKIFGTEESIPAPHARLSNPDLANFLEQLAVEGEALVHGPMYQALVEEFGPHRGGLLTRDDLSAYRPIVRAPLRVGSGARVMLTNPPPSSGGALIGLGLRLAERVLSNDSEPHGDARYVLEVANVLRALAVARAKGYDERVREADAERWLFGSAALAELQQDHDRLRTEHNLGSTTHISVLHAGGEAASLTMSNGEGCGHALDGLGIVVNNFLGEEDINPAGFHRWPAGQRMTTMMAPTIVLEDGRPALVLGSGGSNRIRSAILQVLLARLLSRLPLVEAVRAPRMHVEGSKLWFEAQGLSPSSQGALVERWPDAIRFDARSMFFGGVHAVALEDGDLVGAGDPRRGGEVCVVRR